MALIEIHRRCDECETTRTALSALRSEVQTALLDYQNLYEKVRTNLAKLAKRARLEEQEEVEPEGDEMTKFRKQLVERKLARGG